MNGRLRTLNWVTTMTSRFEHPEVRLRNISAAISSGVVPDWNDMLWLAPGLVRVSNGEPADAAFGFKTKRGQRSTATRAALDQRDRLLREAATRFHGGLPKAAQAQRLHTQLMRYRASAWERERCAESCPGRHLGTIYEFLWRVLKLADRGLSARTLRLILATS